LAHIEAGDARLISRNGNVFRDLRNLAPGSLNIFPSKAPSSTVSLLALMNSAGQCFAIYFFVRHQCVFIAFDLLYRNGKRPANTAAHREKGSIEETASTEAIGTGG
jgi:hypothetical protein